MVVGFIESQCFAVFVEEERYLSQNVSNFQMFPR